MCRFWILTSPLGKPDDQAASARCRLALIPAIALAMLAGLPMPGRLRAEPQPPREARQVFCEVHSRDAGNHGIGSSRVINGFGTGACTSDCLAGRWRGRGRMSPLAEAEGTFAGWVRSHFSPAQVGQLSVSGPAADPDQDGLPNVFEHYFNLNPHQVEMWPVRSLTMLDTNGQPRFALRFPRRKGITDADLAIERTATLGNAAGWNPVSYTEVVGPGDEETETVSAFTDVTAGPAGSNAFFRLYLGLPKSEIPRLGDISSRVAGGDGYSAFPGLALLPDGTLFVIYRKGLTHSSYDGALYYRISTDRGASWSSEALLYQPTPGFDARDAEVCVLKSGVVMVSFHMRDTVSSHKTYVLRGEPAGPGVLTWRGPIEVSSRFGSYTAVAAKAIELAGGDLLLPIYGRDAGDPDDSSAVIRSADGGLTWKEQVTIAAADGIHEYAEPNGVVTDSGRIVVMLRQNNSPKGYAMVYSDDDGVTWSRPINVLSSGAVGKPTVIHLSSGRLFLIGRGAGGTYYSLSLDSGHTWAQWQKLGAGLNVYNSAVMLPPRELAVVYAHEADASARIEFQTFVDWRLDAAAELLPRDFLKAVR